MKKILLLSSMITLSLNVFAGDKPVDCETEKVNVKLYGNYQASCTTSNPYPMPNVTLSEFAKPQESSWKSLTSYEYPFQASCGARLDYYKTVTQDKKVCKYTPKAITSYNKVTYPYNLITYRSISTDRDGSIVKTEWIADGVKHSGTTFQYQTLNGPKQLTLVVTDNDGYKDDKIISN